MNIRINANMGNKVKPKAWSCEHNVVFTLAGCLFTRGLR